MKNSFKNQAASAMHYPEVLTGCIIYTINWIAQLPSYKIVIVAWYMKIQNPKYQKQKNKKMDKIMFQIRLNTL